MEWDIIGIILAILSILSLLGSASIVYVYLHLGVRDNFAIKMVSYLSISDITFNIANLIYV